METVYLCGPIFGTTDQEAKAWRESVQVALAGRYEFLDPMRRDYRGTESANVAAIVEGDEADLQACDVVLVFANRPSWGTAMEIRAAAKEYGKPVHVVAQSPVSPWLAYHATVHATLGDAVVALARRAESLAAPVVSAGGTR